MNLENAKQIRFACLTHAKDLIEIARVNKDNAPHVAYHLAVLALEEVGKSTMTTRELFAPRAEIETIPRLSDDHIKKLFWALWTPILRGNIDRQELESIRDFARKIHANRLEGLYVDWREGQLSIPKERVSSAQAATLVRLAESRLRIEEQYELRGPDAEGLELFDWFCRSSQDPQKRGLLFDKESLEKLSELQDTPAWVKWSKERSDRAQRESQEWLNRELASQRPEGDERIKEKWKMRFRLSTASHVIRDKSFREWNHNVTWMKLRRGRNEHELLVEATLPKNILITELWWAGWGNARRLAVALNIGTMGFFWWQMPRDIGRYYETIEDLEIQQFVEIERTPRLAIAWGNRALEADEMRAVGMIFALAPGPDRRDLHAPFDNYLGGLVFLSKTDVHMQFEPNAFFHFYNSFKLGMTQYGDWDGKRDFRESITDMMAIRFPMGLGDLKLMDLVEIGETLDPARPLVKPLTLSEVGAMKIACDAYFRDVFGELGQKRAAEEAAAETAASSPS